jgi:K+-transporting ATPase ATPase B chain
VPFTAATRMSGVNTDGSMVRKGAADAVRKFVGENGGRTPEQVDRAVQDVSEQGGTPLVVAKDNWVLGVVHLKDIVKGGMNERFDELRRMGIQTVMITGDNKITAGVIAKEAGVDDFLAEATPEAKLALIRDEQAHGRMVAMTGDGTNDAPALAQSDVGVAMNTGTGAALRRPFRVLGTLGAVHAVGSTWRLPWRRSSAILTGTPAAQHEKPIKEQS